MVGNGISSINSIFFSKMTNVKQWPKGYNRPLWWKIHSPPLIYHVFHQLDGGWEVLSWVLLPPPKNKTQFGRATELVFSKIGSPEEGPWRDIHPWKLTWLAGKSRFCSIGNWSTQSGGFSSHRHVSYLGGGFWAHSFLWGWSHPLVVW